MFNCLNNNLRVIFNCKFKILIEDCNVLVIILIVNIWEVRRFVVYSKLIKMGFGWFFLFEIFMFVLRVIYK